MTWAVPANDVALSDADVEAYLGRLRSGWLTMGPSTQEFEAVFASRLAAPHAIAVSSGSAGLQLVLLAAGVGAGDEVIVPEFSFVAVANAVRHVGATVVRCDSIGPLEPAMDPDLLDRLTTRRTRAVVGTYPLGYPAPVTEVRAHCDRHSLTFVEDVATAVGTEAVDGRSFAGTIGHASVFSFRGASAVTLGEGGMVTTDDEALARRVRSLRSHAMTSVTWDRHRGHAATYDVVDIGFNYRLDEPRSALGISQLRHLDETLERRRAVVRRYRSRLQTAPDIDVPWTDDDVAHAANTAFAIAFETSDARATVQAALRARGIQALRHPQLSELTLYRDGGTFPHAEAFAQRHCVLPVSSSLAAERVDEIADVIVTAMTLA